VTSGPTGPPARSGGPHRPARAKTRNVARREVDPARVAAWRVLRAVDDQDAYANLALADHLRAARLTGRDAAFATELTYGTLRGRGLYDAVLAACVDRPLDDVDPPVLDALRLGAHQLLTTRVPRHAAVAATVDLVRAEIGQGAAGFVNAVLRRAAARDGEAWLRQVAGTGGEDDDTRLSVTRSHPLWIVRALRGALTLAGRPADELPALLDADNARPAVAVVALPGLADPAELIASGARPGGLSPLAVTVSGALDDLDAVRSGRARVQDEGSQLVALALAAAPLTGADGGRWLDVCAGPGGKSAVLAAVLAARRGAGELPGGACLLANEVARHRAGLVTRSVAALVASTATARGGQVVEVVTGDGRDLGTDHPGEFDRVLVDAPCTGLGALRRRPEARWRRQPADLAALGPLQRDLLRSALDAVRPGGVVAYATCSPHPAETRAVVTDVLKGRGDVETLDAVAVLAGVTDGRAVAADLGPGPTVQLWPHRHGCDAMFLALLRRARNGPDVT
jgi:16S rRNA (cytosine967-C5)-methyltransferase